MTTRISKVVDDESHTETCWVCGGWGISNPRIDYPATVTVDVCGTCGGSGKLVFTPVEIEVEE